MEGKEYYELLFQHYLNNQSSPEEMEELRESWCLAQNEEEWIQIIQQVIEKTPADKQYQPSEWDERLDKILKASGGRAFRGRVRRMDWYKWVAAVIIGICVAGIFYYTSITQEGSPEVVQTLPGDVLPGTQGAMLTLEDGTRIVLDSLKNGQVIVHGQSQIVVKNGSVFYDGTDGEGMQYHTISTAAGKEYQLKLADGSVAKLNSKSSIRFPAVFSGADRQVEITGEIYFEVAHNSQKPFIVKAGNTEIKVLGTRFNVNAYPDESELKTVLEEGSVEVISANESRTLKPGEMASIEKSGRIRKRDANLDIELGWVRNRFVFENTSIENIMRQVSRWYDVEVVYERKPTQSFVAEIPRDVKASEFFRILEATGWVHFTIEGKKVIVK